MTSRHIAISALGKDRPGIVAALSKVLFQTGCNIEDSSMTLLRSEFAVILIVEMPKNITLAALKKKIVAGTKQLGLTVGMRPLTEREDQIEKLAGKRFALAVYGADKPGIVYKVSQFLADHKINITDVQTSISGKSGKSTYVMLLEVVISEQVKLKEVKSQLTALGKSLNVVVNINQIDAPQL